MSEPEISWDIRHCRKCGYDLTSLQSGLCPECGHTLTPGAIDDRLAESLAGRHMTLFLSLCVCGPAVGGVLLRSIEGVALLLVFSSIYALIAACGLVALPLVFLRLTPPHETQRVRFVWRCTAGWSFWPVIIAGPLAGFAYWFVQFTQAGAVVIVPLFLMLFGLGIATYMIALTRLSRMVHLSLRSRGLLLQLVFVLLSISPLPLFIAFAALAF